CPALRDKWARKCGTMTRSTPNNRYSVGTSAGIHPEDRPTTTSPYPLDLQEEGSRRLPNSNTLRYGQGFVMQMTDHTTQDDPRIRRASRMRAGQKRRPLPQLPPPIEKPAPRRRTVLRHPLVLLIGIPVAITLIILLYGLAAMVIMNISNDIHYGR